MELKVVNWIGAWSHPLRVLRSPVAVGAWITTVVTVMGVGYAVLMPKSSQSQIPGLEKRSIADLAKLGYCKTIATDPNPPLNIRSSPVSAPNNIVGNLKNGAELTVINVDKGWLQISAPLRGWVYEPLTVTTCDPDRKNTPAASSQAGSNPYIPIAFESESKAVTLMAPPLTKSLIPGDALVITAREKFHSGDLAGAMASLRQVPADDFSYAEATSLLKTMPNQWATAVQIYDQAEIALKNNHPNAVLALVSKVPDIRYWRSKMAPLVKLAIEQRN